MERNETTALLLTLIRGVAQHYGMEGADTITFKKRNNLLEKLKLEEEAAWKVLHELIETQLRVDRIMADKEKEQKNAAVWHAELETARNKRAAAGEQMGRFLSAQKILIEGLPETI